MKVTAWSLHVRLVLFLQLMLLFQLLYIENGHQIPTVDKKTFTAIDDLAASEKTTIFILIDIFLTRRLV